MTALLLILIACGSPEPAAEAPAKPVAEAAPEASPTAEQEWKHWGDPFTEGSSAISVTSVLDDPDPHVGKNVRITGEVADVCQKKGCWMVVQDDKARTMRVTMKDHSFGVDMDTTGGLCELEGTVVKKDADPETAAHFASESANPEKAPQGEGTSATYEIVVTAVSIKKQQS